MESDKTKEKPVNARKFFFCILVSYLMLFTAASLTSAYDGDGIAEPGENKAEDLRRAAQNPMADLISFPIQNNTNFQFGPLEKTQNVTNIQPVVPFSLNPNWLLISRTIAPLIYQPELIPGQGSEFGLGDITQALFIGPRNPGRFIWGAGPIFLLPTATDERLGAEKWGAGPAFVGLTMRGPWVFGALVQNIWSFADSGGSQRDDVNQFLMQYFINYNMPNGWYLNSAPIITANWEADSDNRWTIPFGMGVGRVFRIGKLPVNTSIQAYYNVVNPDILGPTWQLRAQMQFLFPKSLK
jgi:hypothetical protein